MLVARPDGVEEFRPWRMGMEALVFILIHKFGGMEGVMGWDCGEVILSRTPFSGKTRAGESRRRGALGPYLQNDCWNRLEM